MSPASPKPPRVHPERHRQHRHRRTGDTLAALRGFTLGSGATLSVSDTAANLLANAAGDAKATSVTLSGTANTVTAAQATVLAALPGFALAPARPWWCPTPPPTCCANAAGAAKATSVSLTGTTNSVTAAQATTLAALHGFALASGATLLVSDSAANLLAKPPRGLAKATSVSLTGTANTVPPPRPLRWPGWRLRAGLRCDAGGGRQRRQPAGHGNAAGIAKATTVSLSGTANTVTAAQANTLAALHRLRACLRRHTGVARHRRQPAGQRQRRRHRQSHQR